MTRLKKLTRRLFLKVALRTGRDAVLVSMVAGPIVSGCGYGGYSGRNCSSGPFAYRGGYGSTVSYCLPPPHSDGGGEWSAEAGPRYNTPAK